MSTSTANAAVKVRTNESSLTKNIIALQRGMMIPTSDGSVSSAVADTIQAELMQLGYILSPEALEVVSIDWYIEAVAHLQKKLGVGNYSPLFKNFPKQVMETSLIGLFRMAVKHYWSEGKWEPDQELLDRGIKFENTEFSLIQLGTEEGFANIFTRLVSINQSITENDKAVVEWFILNQRDSLVMPSTVPFKETLCLLAGHGLNVPVKTATDVLRIATHLSGGDISLPAVPKVTIGEVKDGRKKWFFNNIKAFQEAARERFKFKKFSRSERKYLLGLLEKTNLDLGEMKLKIGRWLRLGEILHPSEYAKQFPRTASAFDVLRNAAKEIKTFNGLVEAAFKESQLKGMAVLSQRPGEYARRLDWMLRNFDAVPVLETFQKIAPKVSRKVLWELYNHFLNRATVNVPRSVMIKGKRSIKKQLEPLPPINAELISLIQRVILNCISDQFGNLEPLGSVWIDERLKNIPLPSAMRSINTSVKTYVRGTRIPFAESAKVIRPYIHWFDEQGYEDLDLSVSFHANDLKNVDHISFTRLQSAALNSCHSGDVRHRQGACAEYVDIDVNACNDAGARYAVVQVHNFQSRPMHTMKDCVFGLMEREYPESNPLFVPKTISNAMTLANESSTVVICIIDLLMKEYIWADLELESGSLATLENSRGQTSQILRSLITKDKLSVYDLACLHARSRGVAVSSPDGSTTQFKYEDFITSYDKAAQLM